MNDIFSYLGTLTRVKTDNISECKNNVKSCSSKVVWQKFKHGTGSNERIPRQSGTVSCGKDSVL